MMAVRKYNVGVTSLCMRLTCNHGHVRSWFISPGDGYIQEELCRRPETEGAGSPVGSKDDPGPGSRVHTTAERRYIIIHIRIHTTHTGKHVLFAVTSNVFPS